MASEVVYGIVDPHLVFIPRNLAEELAAVHRAASEASAWGGLREAMPRRHYDEAIAQLGEEPAASEEFASDQIPGLSEGDWPEWPAQEMLNWMPAQAQALGSVEDSTLNGSFLALDPQKAEEVVSAVEEVGYKCFEDDLLVQEASGY